MPAELLADGKQKRHGSQTFAYPVIRPWLPFNQNKQRLLIEFYQIAKFDDRRNRQVTSKKYVCPPNLMLPLNFGEPLSGERSRAGGTEVIFFMFRKLKFSKN